MFQEAAPQSSDTSVTSAEPTAVPSTPTAAVTVTLERGDSSPAQKAGAADKAVLSEMLLFYLNLAMRAGRAWGNDSLDKLGQVITACKQGSKGSSNPILLGREVTVAMHCHVGCGCGHLGGLSAWICCQTRMLCSSPTKLGNSLWCFQQRGAKQHRRSFK